MWRPGFVLAGAAVLALPFVAHSLTISEGARPLAEALGWLLAVATALAFARGVRFAEAVAVVSANGEEYPVDAEIVVSIDGEEDPDA